MFIVLFDGFLAIKNPLVAGYQKTVWAWII